MQEASEQLCPKGYVPWISVIKLLFCAVGMLGIFDWYVGEATAPKMSPTSQPQTLAKSDLDPGSVCTAPSLKDHRKQTTQAFYYVYNPNMVCGP